MAPFVAVQFQDVVRKRKMVRSFEDRPVPRVLVERIVANAQRAPSAGFSQGWGFLVLQGREETSRYWDATWPAERRADFGWPKMFDAPVVIVCLSNKAAYLERYARPDKAWTDRDEKRWYMPYWHVDTGMAALLILLSAVDLGLGAVFFGCPQVTQLRAAFGVPEEYEPVGTVALGYAAPADRPSPSLKTVGRRPAESVVRWGRWS